MPRFPWSPRIVAFGLVLCGLARTVLAQPEPERIQLECSDGVQVYGFWYAPEKGSGAPVALLLHNPGATHAHWGPLLAPLLNGGFRVLAIDFRGHGDSKELTPEIFEQMSRREPGAYASMIHDVEAAVQWLTSVQKLAPARIAIVGGEYSADLALQALAQNRKLGAVVAMSPSRTYFGFPLVETTKKIGNKPILVLAPKQILNEGPSEMQTINQKNPGFELKVYPKYEHHGVHMLGLNWNVEQTIVQWLGKTFATKP